MKEAAQTVLDIFDFRKATRTKLGLFAISLTLASCGGENNNNHSDREPSPSTEPSITTVRDIDYLRKNLEAGTYTYSEEPGGDIFARVLRYCDKQGGNLISVEESEFYDKDPTMSDKEIRITIWGEDYDCEDGVADMDLPEELPPQRSLHQS